MLYDAATEITSAPELRLRLTPIDEPHRRTIHLAEAAPTTLPRRITLTTEFGEITFTYEPRNDVLASQRFHFTYLDPVAHTRESINGRSDAIHIMAADPLAEATHGGCPRGPSNILRNGRGEAQSVT